EREARERDALEHLVRILLDEEAILERAGLGLVGVAEEVDALPAALLLRGHERPLHPAREARAAAAAEARGLHEVGDLRGRPFAGLHASHDLLPRGVAAVVEVALQRPRVLLS